MKLPSFVYSLVGKFARNKLKLEDGPMNSTKSWWKSTGVWAGAVAVLVAGYNAAIPHFGLPPIPEWAYAILGGLGVYGRVSATSKIG